MQRSSLPIVADGEHRLHAANRAAFESEVRDEYQERLKATTGYWERAAVEEEIEREIKARMKRLSPSPYSLLSSR